MKSLFDELRTIRPWTTAYQRFEQSVVKINQPLRWVTPFSAKYKIAVLGIASYWPSENCIWDLNVLVQSRSCHRDFRSRVCVPQCLPCIIYMTTIRMRSGVNSRARLLSRFSPCYIPKHARDYSSPNRLHRNGNGISNSSKSVQSPMLLLDTTMLSSMQNQERRYERPLRFG